MKYYLVISLTEIAGNIPAENIAGEYSSMEDLKANEQHDTDSWIMKNAPRPEHGKYNKVYIYHCKTM